MRISDWSSDVCSSDLIGLTGRQAVKRAQFVAPPLGTQIGRIGADKIGAAVEAWRITDDTDEIRRQAERRYQARSEEHTSELQSLMRISYAVFCLKKKNQQHTQHTKSTTIDLHMYLNENVLENITTIKLQ